MRLVYFLQFILICLLLGIGFYLETKTGLIPCPLCILQRVMFVWLGFFFILGLLVGKYRLGRIVTNFLISIGAIFGVCLAGRQVYLQHFANPNHAECGVSLQYMLQVLPLQEVAQKVLVGGAECAQRGWIFLSLDMAEWALLWFTGFLLLAVYWFFRDLCARKK